MEEGNVKELTMDELMNAHPQMKLLRIRQVELQDEIATFEKNFRQSLRDLCAREFGADREKQQGKKRDRSSDTVHDFQKLLEQLAASPSDKLPEVFRSPLALSLMQETLNTLFSDLHLLGDTPSAFFNKMVDEVFLFRHKVTVLNMVFRDTRLCDVCRISADPLNIRRINSNNHFIGYLHLNCVSKLRAWVEFFHIFRVAVNGQKDGKFDNYEYTWSQFQKRLQIIVKKIS